MKCNGEGVHGESCTNFNTEHKSDNNAPGETVGGQRGKSLHAKQRILWCSCPNYAFLPAVNTMKKTTID